MRKFCSCSWTLLLPVFVKYVFTKMVKITTNGKVHCIIHQQEQKIGKIFLWQYFILYCTGWQAEWLICSVYFSKNSLHILYCIAGKFGGELNLAVWRTSVCLCNRQIKICQYFLLAYTLSCIHMAIPYWTAKFKSANTFAMAILGPTTKFNSRQYFRLNGIWNNFQVYWYVYLEYML